MLNVFSIFLFFIFFFFSSRRRHTRSLCDWSSDVCSSDLFCEDQLGGLSLTKAGLKKRDRSVFEQARRRGIPVATTLAGGYARRVEDTVRIHVNTILAASEVALAFPSASAART